MMGLSWFAEDSITSFPSRNRSQAQPEPKRLAPASLIFALKSAKLPNAELMALPSSPPGSPPPPFFMIFQNMEWFMWPPPLLRTAAANRFRHFIDLRQQFFDGKFLQVGVAFERFIKVGDVGAVVFVVMDFHGFRVNVGFQSVERIRQRRHCESHLRSGSLSCRSCGHNVPPDLQFLPHNYTRLPGKRGTGSWKYWMR